MTVDVIHHSITRCRQHEPLKFIDLILRIAQFLQNPAQLPLVLGALLHAANRLVQPRGPTNEDFDILDLRFRQDGLEEIGTDVAFSTHPFLGRFVEHVEGAETLGVGVFEVFELAFEEDVFFRDVAEDEGDFGFVGGVVEDGAAELVHAAIGVRLLLLLLLRRGWGEEEEEETYGVIPVPPAMRQM